ncbi:hypothetical protein H2203_006625 [Taxawa tesnikishii (nom. ined.)]|nr:hypothetical protein H2203_006625 [Dothideales sp. JES 119]
MASGPVVQPCERTIVDSSEDEKPLRKKSRLQPNDGLDGKVNANDSIYGMGVMPADQKTSGPAATALFKTATDACNIYSAHQAQIARMATEAEPIKRLIEQGMEIAQQKDAMTEQSKALTEENQSLKNTNADLRQKTERLRAELAEAKVNSRSEAVKKLAQKKDALTDQSEEVRRENDGLKDAKAKLEMTTALAGATSCLQTEMKRAKVEAERADMEKERAEKLQERKRYYRTQTEEFHSETRELRSQLENETRKRKDEIAIIENQHKGEIATIKDSHKDELAAIKNALTSFTAGRDFDRLHRSQTRIPTCEACYTTPGAQCDYHHPCRRCKNKGLTCRRYWCKNIITVEGARVSLCMSNTCQYLHPDQCSNGLRGWNALNGHLPSRTFN